LGVKKTHGLENADNQAQIFVSASPSIALHAPSAKLAVTL
jgi:hypothetical protein